MRSSSSASLGLFVLLLGLPLLAACGGSSPGVVPPPGDGPFEPPSAEEQRLNTDPAGFELSVFPRIALGGTTLYVTWYDRRNGATDVYFNRSLDLGGAWLATDVRLDTDPAGFSNSNVPQIAADGARVYVAWEDQRVGLSQIRFNRSLDQGGTWLADDVRLDRSLLDGSSLNLDIQAVGLHVFVVWQDNRNGGWDIYFNRSLDGGDTWLASDVRLDTDVVGAADSQLPRLAVVGDDVYVVWQDERNGAADIYMSRSEDAGATWLAGDVRLDTDLPGEADSLRPRIAASADVVAVVWEDARDGAFDIRANASEDDGLTFLAQDRRLDTDLPGAGDSLNCELAVDGSTIYVVWEDERFGAPDVRFNHSVDGGSTWGIVDLRLNTDPAGTAYAIQPVVAVDEGEVFVAWADDRQGAYDILLSSSGDDGDTWRSREIRLNTDPLGFGDALAPTIVAASGQAHVVWYDDRFGPGDIYYNRGGP